MHYAWLPCVLALGTLFITTTPGSAADVDPQRLVHQLGHRQFRKRMDAERQLLRMGTASLSAVSNGTRSNDPEVRQRAQRLLSFLQRIAFEENEEQIRNNPWVAAPEIAPGWEVFHSLAGDSPAACELFVDMLKQETSLMLALQRSPRSWPLEFERRCADIQAFFDRRSGHDLPTATIASLLFLAVHPDNHPSSRAVNVVNLLIGDTRFINIVEHDPSGPVLRSLLSHWISNNQNSTPQMRLSLAARFDLDAGVAPAWELIHARKATGQSRVQLQNAIMFVAVHSEPNEVGKLEQLLEDTTALSPSARNGSASREELQVRDVVLLALLIMTKQDPGDYGFKDLRKASNYVYAPNSARFQSAEARQAALDRWSAWAAEHLHNAAEGVDDASEGVLL